MEASFLTQWFSDHEIKAICWTLIHSLWIGMIIALLAGIIISLTRKSAAALRYRLLCVVLVLFVIAIGITYSIELHSNPATPITTGATKLLITITDATSIHQGATVQNQNMIERAREFLNQNMSIIFLVWALFFVLKSLKMVSGLLYIQRIRNYKVHAVAEEFKHKIEMFSRQIGIRQTVCLVQSELVKVPVAIGWLKPLILLPMGIILQLPAEQLDSILWHELAHIRRRDYLVNILQGLVETVFFFNPGLLWLSSLIRAEREACCDDIVLSRMNRKANYLEALLSFGYENNSRTALAMSIGSGNQLRDRLKRMINQENKRLNMAEKIVLAAGLILLVAFTTLPKTAQAVRYLSHLMTKKPVAGAISKPLNPPPPPLPNPPLPPFKKMQQLRNDTTVRFTSVLFKHSDADWANNDISAKDDKGNVYHFIVADGKITSMELNGVKVDESKLPDYEYTLQLIISELMEKRRVRDADIAGFKANQPNVKFKAGGRRFDGKHRDIDSMESADMKVTNDIIAKFKAGGRRFDDKHRDIDSMESADMKVMNDIIANMVAHNVVSKAADVKWFALTYNEFIVNGQKQPDELQQRYKAKYGVHEGRGLYYGPVPMKGKGVFIDPQGMSKALHLNDSIQTARFKARLGTDDERRALKLQMMGQRLHDDSIGYVAQRQRALNVIADLVTDKVVSDATSVKWFGLSNTEFIVNGQKQSDEMQQRYKAKYGIYEGNGLYYGPVQMHGKGIFIDATAANERMQRLPRQPKAPRGPDYKGSIKPKYTDSVEWKNQQLIRQQKLFATEQNDKYQQLIKQQQLFAADQNEKRQQLIKEQQHLIAKQYLQTQQEWLKQQRAKFNIEVQPAITGVIADLVSANVISDKSDLIKFNLTNTELMVNGKKQPDELHEKLKAKYLEQQKLKFGIADDPNFGLHYNVNGDMGIGITMGPDSP